MLNIRIEDGCQATANALEAQLLEALASTLPQAQNNRWLFVVRDEQSRLLGGLSVNTSYGWLSLKTLWVDSSVRQQGVGAKLVVAAEKRAMTANCHGAWLDTSSPLAMAFYSRLGYEVFGELENLPGQLPDTHQRWFMKKMFQR